MNKKLIGALISTLSFGAMADTPSFDYIDLGYSNWDTNNSGSINGFEFKGSKQLNEYLYIAGDYNRISESGSSLSIATIGLGYLNNFSDNSSFFAELDYANLDPESGSGENGYELTIGVRSMLSSNFELKGAVEYLDFDENGTTSLVIGGAYNFTENMAAYIDYKHESDLSRGAIGIRFNF